MGKVLNIGSLNIDKTYLVEKIVQPKETIKALGYEEFCGGKGLNQSVALARAGAAVYHAGAVGKDGGVLLQMLESAGVHTEYIQTLDTVSGHAIIQVEQSGQNSIVIFGGSNVCVSTEAIDRVMENFGEGDILLLQNEISNVGHAMREGKKRGMKVAFNPSPYDGEIETYPMELVDYFLVNEVEGRLMAGVDTEDAKTIIKALKEKYPHAAFVLTMGEEGSYYFDRKREITQKIFEVKAVDTTGAGDTFCGYFIAGIGEGLDIAQVMRRASAASAISVSRKGAAPGIPVLEEVKKMVDECSAV